MGMALTAQAADVIKEPSIGMELARDIASESIAACREDGYQVSADIRQELNHIDGLIVMEGGVRIVSGGYNLGAIGVSGAPGGEKDEACAKKALEKLNERVEFAIE